MTWRGIAAAVLLLLLAAHVEAAGKQPEFKTREHACKTECSVRVTFDATAEQLNCLKRCISDECYEKVYAEDPLEVGEIDDRLVEFKKCFTNLDRNKARA